MTLLNLLILLYFLLAPLLGFLIAWFWGSFNIKKTRRFYDLELADERGKSNDLTQEVEVLRKNRQTQNQALLKLQSEVSESAGIISGYEIELQDKRRERELLNENYAEIVKLKEEIFFQDTALQQQLETKNAYIISLETQLNGRNHKSEDFKVKLALEKTRVAELELKFETMMNTNQIELGALRQEFSELEEKLLRQKEMQVSLEATFGQTQQRFAELENLVEQLQLLDAEKEQEITELRQKLAACQLSDKQLREQLSAAESRALKANAEINRIASKNDRSGILESVIEASINPAEFSGSGTAIDSSKSEVVEDSPPESAMTEDSPADSTMPENHSAVEHFAKHSTETGDSNLTVKKGTAEAEKPDSDFGTAVSDVIATASGIAGSAIGFVSALVLGGSEENENEAEKTKKEVNKTITETHGKTEIDEAETAETTESATANEHTEPKATTIETIFSGEVTKTANSADEDTAEATETSPKNDDATENTPQSSDKMFSFDEIAVGIMASVPPASALPADEQMIELAAPNAAVALPIAESFDSSPETAERDRNFVKQDFIESETLDQELETAEAAEDAEKSVPDESETDSGSEVSDDLESVSETKKNFTNNEPPVADSASEPSLADAPESNLTEEKEEEALPVSLAAAPLALIASQITAAEAKPESSPAETETVTANDEAETVLPESAHYAEAEIIAAKSAETLTGDEVAAKLTEPPSLMMQLLAEEDLPELPAKDYARLQIQSPNRIWLYWSLQKDPYLTLQKAFGSRANAYSLALRLVNVETNETSIYPGAVKGSFWFNEVKSGTKYRVDVGFATANRPFIRLLSSNIAETPRPAPSPRMATDKDFAVRIPKFVEILDASGYSHQTAPLRFATATASEADAKTVTIVQKLSATALPPLEKVNLLELRWALLAILAGVSLDEVKKSVSPELTAWLSEVAEQNPDALKPENVQEIMQTVLGGEFVEAVVSGKVETRQKYVSRVFGGSAVEVFETIVPHVADFPMERLFPAELTAEFATAFDAPTSSAFINMPAEHLVSSFDAEREL